MWCNWFGWGERMTRGREREGGGCKSWLLNMTLLSSWNCGSRCAWKFRPKYLKRVQCLVDISLQFIAYYFIESLSTVKTHGIDTVYHANDLHLPLLTRPRWRKTLFERLMNRSQAKAMVIITQLDRIIIWFEWFYSNGLKSSTKIRSNLDCMGVVDFQQDQWNISRFLSTPTSALSHLLYKSTFFLP